MVQKRRCFITKVFAFELEYAIRNVQENQMVLKLNGEHQILAYADDLNLLGDNIATINKIIQTVIVDSKEVGLEMNIEETKHMLLFHHQNAGQNHDVKLANRWFENVSYLNIWEQQ
jgi:hypothetical protein